MTRNAAAKERERTTFYFCAIFLGLALTAGVSLMVLG